MVRKSIPFIIVLIAGLAGGIYLSSIPSISENLKVHGLLEKTAGKFWQESKEIPVAPVSGGKPDSFADLAAKEEPKVVNISTSRVIKQRVHPFFGFESP